MQNLYEDHRILMLAGNNGNGLGQPLYFVILIFRQISSSMYGGCQQLTSKHIH